MEARKQWNIFKVLNKKGAASQEFNVKQKFLQE